jgi:acetyltransferase-like isoleucine patch superfamily enzyme
LYSRPAEPLKAARTVVALWRGLLFPAKCKLLGRRFSAGRNLKIFGRLYLKGPGKVVLGDNVVIDRLVTPWTYSSEAQITIGSDTYLNGTRFGCKQSISIGRLGIVGDASISDTDFHSTHVDRRNPLANVRTAAVAIEENVWVASAVGILPGTRIGTNSVVGYGAVCAGVYPPNSIIVGNPAKVIKAVPGTQETED